jgi:hypothetical protein
MPILKIIDTAFYISLQVDVFAEFTVVNQHPDQLYLSLQRHGPYTVGRASNHRRYSQRRTEAFVGDVVRRKPHLEVTLFPGMTTNDMSAWLE